MTGISPTGSDSIGRVGRVQDSPGRSARADETTPAQSRGADRVEVSSHARYLSKLRDLPVRQDVVDKIKAEIESGTYDTPDKFEKALDALLSEDKLF